MINQVSVFLENDKGRLSSLCYALGEASISMSFMTVADTAEYGVARIICDTPERAKEVLVEKGFMARLTSVCAVKLSNDAGALAKLLDAFEDAGVNVEYAYCFGYAADSATAIIKADDVAAAEAIAEKAGLSCVAPEEVYALD